MSDLRELLGHPPRPQDEEHEYEDITDEFFAECEKLEEAEMAFMPNFRLSDAMSAVELMDPKMDIGIHRYRRTTTVESLISEGYFDSVTDEEVLAITDATLCCLASFLNGGNISNTLYTNVLLFAPEVDIPHKVLNCLSKTFSHVLPLVRAIIATAMVYEEEDFNGTLPYLVPIVLTNEEIVKMITSVEEELLIDATDWTVRAVLASRFTWLRLFLQLMAAMVPPLKIDDDALDGRDFVPNLDIAREIVNQMMRFGPVAETSKLGSMNKDEDGNPLGFEADGKFEWLRVFDPDFNKMYLTGSFPRATIIPNRPAGLRQFYALTYRLKHMACEMRNYLGSFEGIRDLLKVMCDSESCILSRSILQLTLIPFDDMVIGQTHLYELVEKSVQRFTQCVVLREGSTASTDAECVSLFNDFIDDFSKVALTIVAHYGMNAARQREKLQNVIDEVCQSMKLADLVDNRTKEVSNQELPIDQLGNSLELYHYLYDCLIFLIENHIELTVDLHLLSPHEYASTFWYYGDVVMRWPMTAMQIYQTRKTEQAKLMGLDRPAPVSDDKSTRYDRIAHRVLLMHARKNACHGVVFACYAMTKMGFIQQRAWDENSERLRFEQRMCAFKSSPFHHNFESYLEQSGLEAFLAESEHALWSRALHAFMLSSDQFTKIQQLYQSTTVPMDILRQLHVIVKGNIVACRCFANGIAKNRIAKWVFDKTKHPTFPLLKIV